MFIDFGRYQGIVGKLIYLPHTRPDIAFSVSVVSQFIHSPYEEHLKEIHRILRYLLGNLENVCLKENSERNVVCFH